MEPTKRPIDDQSVPRETFVILDTATGKRRAIREMTNEELQRNLTLAKTQLEQAHQALQRTQNLILNTTGVVGVLQYEQERRRHSIKLI